MFYIYHVPGVKIGCSQTIKDRIRRQKFSHYEILEEHYDIFEASDREIKLQKQYGYTVDKIPYWLSIEQITKAQIKAEKTRHIWGPKVYASNIGRKHSNETKEKISKNHAPCSGKNNAFYGKTHTDEVKQKLSQTKKGKPWTEARRMAYENKIKNKI